MEKGTKFQTMAVNRAVRATYKYMLFCVCYWVFSVQYLAFYIELYIFKSLCNSS